MATARASSRRSCSTGRACSIATRRPSASTTTSIRLREPLLTPWINGGQVTGWQPGSRYLTTPSSTWIPVDEPLAYAGGGKLIYYQRIAGTTAGAFDVTIANTRTNTTPNATREWTYFDFNLPSLAPGYRQMASSGGYNGLTQSNAGPYGDAGDQNPPIPYATAASTLSPATP